MQGSMELSTAILLRICKFKYFFLILQPTLGQLTIKAIIVMNKQNLCMIMINDHDTIKHRTISTLIQHYD